MKTKIIKSISLLIILSLFASFAVVAYADGAVELAFTGEETDTGYTVTLDAQNITGIAMMQFNVTYDSSNLSCTSVSAGTALTGNVGPTINSSGSGTIIFIWDSLRSIKTDGTLMVIEFERIGTGDAAVQLDTGSTMIFAYDDFSQPGVSCEPLVLKGTEPAATAAPTEAPAASSAPAATAKPEATEKPAATAKPSATAAPAATPKPTAAVTDGTNGDGLTLSTNSQQLTTGETAQITVEESTSAVYTSSNESVATVDESGNVTAVGEGTAIITVTSEDGTSFSTCNVAVGKSEATGSDSGNGGSDTDSQRNQPTDGNEISEESNGSAVLIAVICIIAVMAIAAVVIIKKKKSGIHDEEQ